MDWQTLVIWQDDDLLVVNKPAGLLSLPDGYNPTLPHLRVILEPHLGRLWIVHRLDRDTSGVILLARSQSAHRDLNKQFEQHQVEKTYHAIVFGNPDWEATDVDLPLRTNVGRRKRTAVDPILGKPAQTKLKLLERLGSGGYSLVEAQPKTGRTHQVRAHLAAIGHPIAGDPLYGPPDTHRQTMLSRTALHAWRLHLHHPITGESLEWYAVYPDDFQKALQAARF